VLGHQFLVMYDPCDGGAALVASASIAPLCRKAQYLDRSIAACSQVSVVVPKAFMLCLMMSLKRSFGPLAGLMP